MIPFLIVLGIVVVIILAVVIYNIRIVKQTDNYIIERLGSYKCTWTTGIHFLIPFIDRVSNIVSSKEQVKDFDPQPVITKDNVTMQIDTVVYYRVTDANKYTYGVSQPISAIENLTATTLRNIVGELELDETLTSRDIINTKMREILDEATDAWGIKVFRVELKNILPPKDIRDSMEKQMRAEREKREKILLAEGEKQSQILLAEGEKESTVIRAKAEKEKKVLEAEADAEAIKLRKTAEAEGIKAVKEAEAQGIELINNSKPSTEAIQVMSLEAYRDVANGQATKIIIPSNLQDLTGIISAVEAVKSTKDDTRKKNLKEGC